MAACYESDEFSDGSSEDVSFPDIPVVGALIGRPLKTPQIEKSPSTPISKVRFGLGETPKAGEPSTSFVSKPKSLDFGLSDDSPPAPGRIDLDGSPSPVVLGRGNPAKLVFDPLKVKVESDSQERACEKEKEGFVLDRTHEFMSAGKGSRLATSNPSKYTLQAGEREKTLFVKDQTHRIMSAGSGSRVPQLKPSEYTSQSLPPRCDRSVRHDNLGIGRGPTNLDSKFEEVVPQDQSASDDCPSLGDPNESSESEDQETYLRKIAEDPVLRRKAESFHRQVEERRKRRKQLSPRKPAITPGVPKTVTDKLLNPRGLGASQFTRELTSTILGKGKKKDTRPTVTLSSDSEKSEDEMSPEIVRTRVKGAARTPPKRKSAELMRVTKLDGEDIRQTSRKYCCKHHCLLSLNASGIREARIQYFRQKSQDQSSSLQWLINQDAGEENGGRLKYNIGSRSVCRVAFKAVLCVGNNRIARVVKTRNSDITHEKPLGRPKDIKTLVVVSWLRDFFKTRLEALPNKNVFHLPDNYTKFEVWKIFDSSFGSKDETMSAIGYRQFARLWSSNFPNVKIPPVSRFSTCADCEEFKTLRDKAVLEHEKKAGEEMLQKHRDQQSKEREKLAKHRKKCFSNPEEYVGIVIDGMDQKKTRLPHWPRTPKSVDESCLLQLHVVGSLIFHGELHSRVFLNYPNLHNDGNLIVTILQRLLNEWEKKPGGLPPVLYLQLDNTPRENKNNLLMAYLHMLVEKKVFKKIKIGFLLVGHTHDQIDQMFSRFSRRLSKHKAYTFDELRMIISDSYKPEPIITLLTETFDFRRFAFTDPSIVVATMRNITFSHQYKITFDIEDAAIPRQWGKKFSTDTEWLPREGVQLLKDDIPEKIMWSSPGIALSKKGEKRTLEKGDSRKASTSNATPTNEDQMELWLAEIEKGISASYVLLSDDQIQWWSSFFQQQREYNSTLHLSDRPLVYRWDWPCGKDHLQENFTVDEVATFTEQDTDDRVYGPSREIYVKRYRPQEIIDTEKENMDGDFSDLMVGRFISVAGEETESEGKFWIAKVEKILERNESNIPYKISVLWYNVKRGQDPWKGKYYPEVLGYEKKKSKGRGKANQKPVWYVAELDLLETTIFAYNFSLSKNDVLYKRTIERIQIRMAEYLKDLKADAEANGVGMERSS